MKNQNITLTVIGVIMLSIGKIGFSQNIAINTDGTAGETGVMLDIKEPTAKATTAAVQTFFQLKSFDANTDALKLRLGFKTDITQANRYGFIDFPDFTASVPTYLPLCLQPSGGNVGIGTTSPAAGLDIVYGGVVSSSASKILHSGTAGLNPGTALRVSNGYPAAGGNYEVFGVYGNSFGSNYFSVLDNGRTYLTAVNEQYGLGVKYVSTGGAVYFGAKSGVATPDAVISSAGGATLMTLQDGGNVGIGTTSPSYPLDVRAGTSAIQARSTTNGNNSTFYLFANNTIGTNFQREIMLNSNSDLLQFSRIGVPHLSIDGNGNVGIGTTAPNGPLDVRHLGANGGNAIIFSNGATPYNHAIQANFVGGNNITTNLQFLVSTLVGSNMASVMTLTASGNVGIGTTSPSEKLEVCGNLKVIGTITAQGAITTNGAITCSSDKRYKKDISPLINSLDGILKIQGVNYFWRVNEFPEKKFTDARQVGFIAQDLEKIYPEVVFTDKDGYKSVDYSRLTPVLVEAIKEQQKIIELHEKQNEEQNQNIQLLKEEIKKIKTQLSSQASK